MKFKKAGIVTILLIVLICAYAIVSLIRLNSRVTDAKSNLASLQDTVTAQEIKNDEMRYAIDHKDDVSFKTDIARNELGLVSPDDKVFYDSGN